ncbi:MAG: hypothetical protein ACAI37_01740 [Chthoniobacter sp.]
MALLAKTVRSAAFVVAFLFLGLSLLGIFGVWMVDRKASEIALKGFGFVETAIGVADAGLARVNDLLVTSREEVAQASETINAVGARPEANRPVLNGLNERLGTSLAPHLGQMKQMLGPVRDAVGMIRNAVSLANSFPAMTDRAPRIAALDEAFNRLEGLTADTTQLRSTLRELALAQTSELSPETMTMLNGLTQRIDARLGEVQASVHEVQADSTALRSRLELRKSRLLFFFNLLALLSVLMLAWIIYSQIIVIRHHRR